MDMTEADAIRYAFNLALVASAIFLIWFLVVRPVTHSQRFIIYRHTLRTGVWKAVEGFRTRIVSIVIMICTGLVSIYDQLLPLAAGIDWGPLTASIPQWAWPLILFGTAALFLYLRKISSGPPAKPAPLLSEAPPQIKIKDGE